MTLKGASGGSPPYSSEEDLTLTNNLTLTGNLTVDGTFTFGDAGTDNLNVLGYLTVSGTPTNGISVTGATTTAIRVTGSATTAFATLTGTFGTGVSIGGTVTTGIAIGACVTGLTVTNATHNGIIVSIAALAAGDSYSGVYSSCTGANASNSYGGAGYFEFDVSGTQGGEFVYGLGGWINLDNATNIGAGNYLCAQDNGVYITTISGTLTNARVVFGMRAECIMPSTNALKFPFSINTNNQPITAVFDTNNISDLGVVADAGTGLTEILPIARDAAGNMRYVKLYSHT